MRSRDYLRFGRDTLTSVLIYWLIPPLAPLPILGFAVGFRHATLRALAAAAFGAAALALIVGLTSNQLKGAEEALYYFGLVGTTAVSICYLIDRRIAFDRIVVVVGGVLVALVAVAGLLATGSPEALALAVRNAVTSGMGQAQKFWAGAGLDAAASPDLRASLISSTIELAPALCVIFAGVMVLLNLAIFWSLSGGQRRVGYPLFGDIVRWATPEWLIWVFLATGFGFFVPSPALSLAALNCFVCIAAIYFFQGLAIMGFYFRVLAMPTLARGLVFALAFIQPVLPLLICAVGVFDMWIDFRRLKPPSPEARNLGDYS